MSVATQGKLTVILLLCSLLPLEPKTIALSDSTANVNATFKNSEDFAKLKATNPSKASQIAQEVETVLARGDKAITDLAMDYAKLADNKVLNFTDFRFNGNDQYIDIIVHFSNGKFKAIVEEGGRLVEKAMDAEHLVSIMGKLPTDKPFRLLSCNDIATAKQLSKQFSQRPLYASDGWVDLYADGAIQSQRPFKKLVNGEDLASVEMKTPSSTTTTIRLGEELVREGGLFAKLDHLGLQGLKREVNLLETATKTKFLTEFAGASDDALKAMNDNPSLLTHWKEYGDVIKNKVYPNAGHKAWEETRTNVISDGNSVNNKILTAVENATPPTNNQVAVAGAYSPELGGNVVIKYNDRNFNVKSLEPELQQHLDYLAMIKNDFDKGGNLYQKLYSNVPPEKIQNAGIAGTHAEILAVNEVVKLLKQHGKFNSIRDLNKIHVLVKGRASFGNMCRCPHCFLIIDGVKMIGNQ